MLLWLLKVLLEEIVVVVQTMRSDVDDADQ
jgi:hypothetical protein